MIEVCLLGTGGRVSNLIREKIASDHRFCIAQDIPDVYIDFTHQSRIEENLLKAIDHKKPIVIGTTGLDDDQFSFIKRASSRIKVLYAPNMTYGIEVLRRAMVLAAKMMERDHDMEIHELHHKFKKDAPSGTALSLAKTVQDLNLKWKKIKDYQEISIREEGDIGVCVSRGGEGYNAHTVSFVGQDGMFELKYHNWNASTYAKGALESAKFLIGLKEERGLFSMKDLII